MISTVNAQFDFNNCETCPKAIKAKLSKTSLWLGQVSSFSFTNNRVNIDFEMSLFEKKNFLPSFSYSLKLTRNLIFISKIFSLNHGNQSPHICGLGIVYASKTNKNSNWISSLQKVNLRGLSDYRLSTITIGVSKVLSYKIVNLSYGLGSVFYDQKFYKPYQGLPRKNESQINFMHLSGSTKIKSLQFETKISGNFNVLIFSCSFKKGII